jgi:nucleoside-diphosphate-sugar epimerase
LSGLRVAVTGANGYLGSRVCAYLAARNCEMVAVGRAAPAGVELIQWALDENAVPEMFRGRGIDALVHCAYDFRPVKRDDIRRINVDGSVRLLQAANAAGIRNLVLISSVSAFDGCRSLYGRAKLAIEAEAGKLGGVTIRPCLIWGDNPGGMFGALSRSAKNAGVIPMIAGGSSVQYLVHEDDVCEAVLRAARGEIRERQPISAGAERRWTLRELISMMAKRAGRNPALLPVPWRLVWTGLKTAEMLGLKLGFRSDSVISLIYQNPAPDFSVARRVGLTFRDLS